MSEIRIFLLLFSLTLLVVVVDLVRRRHLREKYSLIWVAVPILLLAVSLWPGLLERFSKMFGVYYPPSLGFIAGIMFLLVVTLMLSVVVSHHSDRIIKLTQELSLVQNRIQKIEKEKKLSSNKENTNKNNKST